MCGFDSKSIPMHDLIKDMKVSLAVNKDIVVLMDKVVIRCLGHVIIKKMVCFNRWAITNGSIICQYSQF